MPQFADERSFAVEDEIGINVEPGGEEQLVDRRVSGAWLRQTAEHPPDLPTRRGNSHLNVVENEPLKGLLAGPC